MGAGRLLDIAAKLADVLRSGERAALATVVKTTGPTPRPAGARMAIRSAGNHLGTVGGGCGEAAVIQAGLAALDAGTPRFVRVDLTDEVTEESEAACGGTMECLVRPWGAELLPVVETVLGAVAARRPTRLLTCLAPGEAAGAMAVVAPGWPGGGPLLAQAGLVEEQARALTWAESDPRRCAAARDTAAAREIAAGSGPQSAGPQSVLLEELEPPPVMLVCGGGHIALPLAEIGRTLGFEVVVIDDRPSFANQARFPWAQRVVCGAFGEVLTDLPIDERTYAVIVTRGHRQDMVCLRRLLGRGAGYLGMIGSRRRVAAVLKSLRDEGIPAETLAGLHSPIGLDIGAETPAEIAVAILAEIVLARRGGSGRPLTITSTSHRKGGPDGP